MRTAEKGRLLVLLIVLVASSILSGMTAFAVDDAKPTSHVLDGMKFVGETGEEGKEAKAFY